MAQLKDLIVNGASRLIGDTFTNKIQITTINAPTSSGSSTYGPGNSGQVLKTDGTSIYWGSAGGTVTSITAGTGLRIGTTSSGGTITTTGTINHINSVTAQTTQAVYPIKIDAQGHISAYGTAVTIPTKTSELTNDSGFITAAVIGIKGNAETYYRAGMVNLTAEDIGAASLVNGKVSPGQASSDIVTLTIPSGTTSYNLSTNWIGKIVLIEASNDVSIVVPDNSSFAIGTEIEIISNTTYTITITTAAASSVSVFSLEGLRSIAGQYGAVCLKKISSSQWILAGALA